jgi:hypothetical protein
MSLLITGLTLDKIARLRCVKKQAQSGTNCDVSNGIKCLSTTAFLRPLLCWFCCYAEDSRTPTRTDGDTSAYVHIFYKLSLLRGIPVSIFCCMHKMYINTYK